MAKNKPKCVILDVDDTLVLFCSFLCYLHNKLNNTCVTENDITDWDFDGLDLTDVRGNRVTGKQLRATFLKYEPLGLYACLPVCKESRFGLQLIHKLGYKIILMTARKKEFEGSTLLNLIKNDIPYDEIYFEKDKVKKIKQLSKQYDIQLFADDKLITVLDVAENTHIPNICLIKKAHNEKAELPDNVRLINTVFDAVRFLEG